MALYELFVPAIENKLQQRNIWPHFLNLEKNKKNVEMFPGNWMKYTSHTIKYQKMHNSCCKKWCNRQNNISDFLSNLQYFSANQAYMNLKRNHPSMLFQWFSFSSLTVFAPALICLWCMNLWNYDFFLSNFVKQSYFGHILFMIHFKL